MSDKDVKFHFYMACLEISFADDQGQTGITRVNSMIKSDDGVIGVRLLGRTQQAAQIQLMKNLNDEKLNILNVIFVSINYLGEMTDAQFHLTEEQASGPTKGTA